MKSITCFALLLLIAWAGLANDDAYQLLRSDPSGYAEVLEGRPITFPRDHLPHPDYRMEWWYLTANLTDNEGREFGVHWTLFRQSMDPVPVTQGWSSNQVWMAHAAIHLPDRHIFEERFARGGIGQAGVERDATGNLVAWLDDWQLLGDSASPLTALQFTVDNFKINLQLKASTPWVLQGKQGVSQKSALGQASYYFSQPHIEVTGTLQDDTGATQLTGLGWLDREWSSQPLAPDQPGWDWLAIHLDDGHALMVYRLRQDGGQDTVSGSWVTPEGESISLTGQDVIFEPLSTSAVSVGTSKTRNLPLRWRVELPSRKLAWTVSAVTSDSWLNTAFPYWEGPVQVTGSGSGKGYLELTGY